MLIFTTRGGLVSRCDEYIDSTAFPKLEWPGGAQFL
jgi:hypothetical protein